MAPFDYLRSRATADRLIERFGQAGTLSRPTLTGTAHNPIAGEPLTYPTTFAVLTYEAKEIDGSRILATDKKVLLAKKALDVEPTTTDKLVIGGVPHSILGVEPLSPGGVIVLWTLQCRR